MKIAFIGDSFSAYHQDGQLKNSWTYQLSQQFPQHEYHNYACGGRGYDYYQWCLLDAKIQHDVDLIFTNRTFNHRVGKLWGNQTFRFEIDKIGQDKHMYFANTGAEYNNRRYEGFEISDNYTCWNPNKEIWYSAGLHERVNIMSNPKKVHPMEAGFLFGLQDESSSEHKQSYNDQWYDNMHNLYNFKHIIKLELLHMSGNLPSATKAMYAAHGINKGGLKPFKEEQLECFKAGLIVSPTDDHWSRQGNMWALKNYILTKETIDILSEV